MPFPKTLEEMKQQGYKYKNDNVCECGDDVEWWETPRGFSMKFNPMEKGTSPAMPHNRECPEAKPQGH
jgi:hypothetical protein